MKHVNLLAAVAFAVVVAVLVPGASTAETMRITAAQKDCYGDTLELRLERGPGFILSIPLAAFTPELSLLSGPGNRSTREREEWFATCHPEPVEIESIYAPVGHRPVSGLGLTAGGPSPSRFEIRGGEPFDFERRHGRLARNFAENYGAVRTAAGFTRLGPAPVGFFMAPDGYRDPQGGVFGFECISGIECSTAYEVKCGAVLTYWFVANLRNYDLSYQNIPPEDQWLELDRRMRRAVEPLIVCDPESTDQVGGKP